MKGRKQKYNQPKNRPLFVKVTESSYQRIQSRANEYHLSKGELIEQFARTPWLSPSELDEVRHLLEILRDRLVMEMASQSSPVSSDAIARYRELLKLVQLLNQLSVTNLT